MDMSIPLPYNAIVGYEVDKLDIEAKETYNIEIIGDEIQRIKGRGSRIVLFLVGYLSNTAQFGGRNDFQRK